MNPTNNDDLFFAIGRLEGKMDAMISMQHFHQDQIKEHDNRLRSLEHARGYILGWAAAIGASISIVFNLFIK